MRLFDYTLSSPPPDEQFYEISKHLLCVLLESTGIAFEVTHNQLEPSSWITTKLRAESILVNTVNLSFIGIVSYSLREGPPAIQSVLLAFSSGKRLRIGQDSILTSRFVMDQSGNRWEQFKWSRDEFLEWECEELPI